MSARFFGFAALLLVMVSGAAATARAAIVPNYFQRDCSYITWRCTSYHQVNGPYSPAAPIRYLPDHWVMYRI